MNECIKIMVIGSGEYSFYEHALCEAFKEIGYKNTHLFGYEQYLAGKSKIDSIQKVIYKIQNKFSFGFGINRLNKDILKKCELDKPDFVFLYRCRAVYPKTVRRIQEMGCKVFSYNNDNPFSEYYPKYFWRHYKNSISYCDVNYVYRESNIKDCEKYGSKITEVLRSYYIEKRNYLIERNQYLENIPDVVFLGHHEKDARKEYIEALAESGVKIGLPIAWKDIVKNDNIVFLENTGIQYNEMLNSAKIALVFLSTLNKDTYTRRCFEIPATGTMMLSVYTEDLSTLFTPDREAVYFVSKEELVEKTKFYLAHDKLREDIGKAGYERLIKDGHEVKDRARQIINKYIELNGNQL